jgi:hypothetical protein
MKISVLCIIILLIPLANILSFFSLKLFKIVSEYLKKSLKYTLFLRYFIQTHFELVLNAIIGIQYSLIQNTAQKIDIIVCWLILVTIT